MGEVAAAVMRGLMDPTAVAVPVNVNCKNTTPAGDGALTMLMMENWDG